MNDPLSRKLFQPREAREKLRSMGGIMSSSPELASTVQKFQVGGPVQMPPNAMELLYMNEAARRGPQTRSPDVRLRNIATDQVPSVSQDIPPNAMELLYMNEAARRGPQTRSPDVRLRNIAEEEPVEPSGFFDLLARSSGAARQTPIELDEMARQSAEEAAAIRAEQGITRSLGPASAAPSAAETTETEDAGDTVGEDTAAPPPPILDPEQPETFETSYEQMLERLQGVMGKKDVDTRKKAMANLAMIGLAIASGQSPNALTNIAQGALSGMQAIRAEEASREEQDRAVRMAAMKAALDQESGMRSTEAESARDERKFQQQMQLEVLKSGLKGQGGQEVSPLDPFAESVLKVAGDMITNEGGDYTDAVRRAYGIVQNLPGYAGMDLPPVEGLLVQPEIKSRVDQALSQNVDPAKIRSDLEAQFPGIDPSLYGL